MTHPTKIILGGVCAAAIGFAIGRSGSGAAEDPAQQETPAGQVSKLATTPEPAAAGEAKPVASEGAPASWRRWAERIAAAATSDDLAAIYLEVTAVKSDWDVPHEVRLLLAARWVEIDPAAGLRFLFEDAEPSWLAGQQRIALALEWAMVDPEAAREAIKSMERSKFVMQGVLEGLQWRDPSGALAFVRALGDFVRTDGWLDAARTDPEGFAQMVVELREGMKEGSGSTGTRSLLRAAGEALFERDPERALEWGRNLPDWMRDDGLGMVIETLAKNDPKRAGELFVKLTGKPYGNARSSVGRTILRELCREDLKAGLDWRASARGSGFVSLALALNPLIANGEISANDIYHAIKGRSFGSVSSLFEELPRPIRAEVVDLIVADGDSRQGQELAASLVDESAWRDLADAPEVIAELSGDARASALRALGKRLEQFGFQSLEPLPPGDRSVAIHAWTKGGGGGWPAPPNDIAAMLEAEPPSEVRAAAAGGLAGNWGAFDPQAALDWAASLADPAMSRAAAEGAVGTWAKIDSLSLSTFLLEQPAGPVRDGAISRLIEALPDDDRTAALRWAEQIGDEATRHRLLEQIATEGGEE